MFSGILLCISWLPSISYISALALLKSALFYVCFCLCQDSYIFVLIYVSCNICLVLSKAVFIYLDLNHVVFIFSLLNPGCRYLR